MRSLERVNIRTNVRTYVLTYIRTGQTLYPLHNFVVRGDNKCLDISAHDAVNDVKTIFAFQGFFIIANFVLEALEAIQYSVILVVIYIHNTQ